MNKKLIKLTLAGVLTVSCMVSAVANAGNVGGVAKSVDAAKAAEQLGAQYRALAPEFKMATSGLVGDLSKLNDVQIGKTLQSLMNNPAHGDLATMIRSMTTLKDGRVVFSGYSVTEVTKLAASVQKDLTKNEVKAEVKAKASVARSAALMAQAVRSGGYTVGQANRLSGDFALLQGFVEASDAHREAVLSLVKTYEVGKIAQEYYDTFSAAGATFIGGTKAFADCGNALDEKHGLGPVALSRLVALWQAELATYRESKDLTQAKTAGSATLSDFGLDGPEVRNVVFQNCGTVYN